MELSFNEPWITSTVRCQGGYAYIDKPFWNADKQRADHKREYIGKYDGNVFTPNKTYFRLKEEYEQSLIASKTGPVPTDVCLRQFYGSTYLLNEICNKTGIAADLGKCFGSLASQILSIAYYLVLEEGQPMYRFQKWGRTHRHPFGKDIPSQRSSELFGLISEESKMAYFKYQAKRHGMNEYLAFDTTSISSYSTLIKQAKYGKNKESDPLPQINLALLYGEESMLPVYYRKLAGNITDVKTIENLIKDVDFLNLEKLKLVMDRGFYSEKNINDLMKHHHKFLIGVKTSLKIVSSRLDSIRSDFVTRYNYNSELKLYIMSFTEEWDYTEEKPRSGEIVSDTRRVYLHFYYNDQKATDDKTRFNAMLDRLEENLVNGTPDPADEKLYQKYFTITETPVRGKVYAFKENAIRKAEQNYGYFVLMTNGIKDPVEALRIYRLKDLIEKSFGNLKERLSMRRMSVSSEENFEGKLFIQFVALQLVSYIKKQMDENGLFSNYTIQSLLDELDTIEYYQQPGKAHHLSEITEKQRHIYELMDVRVPT
jgi:transposase